MRILNLLLLSLVAISLAAHARACQITTEALEFGTIEPDRGASGRGKVAVLCAGPQSFAVGLTSQNDGAQRLLFGPGTALLVYQIFTDASLSVPWGDNFVIGPTVGAENDGVQPTELTLFAEIYANQGHVPPGDYTDRIIVTVNF